VLKESRSLMGAVRVFRGLLDIYEFRGRLRKLWDVVEDTRYVLR